MSVINEFCERVDVRDLARGDGATFVGDRYRRPGKEDAGFSGIVRRNKAGLYVLCTWSENDPANDRKFGGRGGHGSMGIHDAFSYYCLTRHGGDVKAAVKAAAEKLGMRHRKDNEVHGLAIDDPSDGEQYAALWTGDTVSVGGDVDAAFERMAEILRRHTNDDHQVARITSRSKLMREAINV